MRVTLAKTLFFFETNLCPDHMFVFSAFWLKHFAPGRVEILLDYQNTGLSTRVILKLGLLPYLL